MCVEACESLILEVQLEQTIGDLVLFDRSVGTVHKVAVEVVCGETSSGIIQHDGQEELGGPCAEDCRTSGLCEGCVEVEFLCRSCKLSKSLAELRDRAYGAAAWPNSKSKSRMFQAMRGQAELFESVRCSLSEDQQAMLAECQLCRDP